MNLYVSLCVGMLTLLPGYHGLQAPANAGVDTCPPWLYRNDSSSCVCGRTDIPGTLVSCNETLQVSYLLLDYCMTYNTIINDTQLFYCPYEMSIKHKQLKNERQVIVNTTVSNLVHFFCGSLKREGPFCERCKENHGPSVFSQNLQCINCSGTMSGWAYYIVLEYFPLTVFFSIITLTGITPLSGSMNSFVMLSQLFSLLFAYGNQDQLVPLNGVQALKDLVRFIQTAYGFWNLDFFRAIVGNSCVSSKLTNLQAISLHLMPPFYPPLLLIIGSILIFLHSRNCRPFVRAWKPFKRCLSHYPVPNDIKSHMIRLFITFYILSYTKILYTCTLLLARGYVFPMKGNTSLVLIMSPDIGYFSSEHASYAALATFLLVTVIILPAVYLTVHPLLEKKCGRFRRLKFLQIAVDTFSSCFRDGKDGTGMDCRHFAGAFLLLRIVTVMLFSVIWSPLITYFIIAAIFFIATVTVGVCRPYKKSIHNLLDIIFFFLLAIGILCGSIASSFPNVSGAFQTVFTVFVLFSFLAPLLYASLYVGYRLVKFVVVLVTCCCKKRRRYDEVVTNYNDYLTSSNEHSNYGTTPK